MKEKELLESLKGPFVLDRDKEYYLKLCQKLKDIIDLLKSAGANKKLISEANKFRDMQIRK